MTDTDRSDTTPSDAARSNGTAGTDAPPPPPPTPRPPFRRPRQGRVLTGVAAGLADHLGVDVSVVRIVIVVGALLTQGLVVLAYIAATVFVPASDAPVRPASETSPAASGRDPSFWVGVGLLVVGALWLLGGPFASGGLLPHIGGDAVLAVVLIGFGLALWRAGESRTAGRAVGGRPEPRGVPSDPSGYFGPEMPGRGAAAERPEAAAMVDDTTRRLTAPPADPPQFDAAGGTYSPYGASFRSGVDHGGTGGMPPAPPAPGVAPSAGWTPPPRPPRESSVLTAATLGAALVVAGILWSLDLAGVLDVGVGHVVAASLGVVGIGLLIGSVAGRGRWLILVGALLVPIVVGAELLRPFALIDLARLDSSGPNGRVIERPLTVADVEGDYELGAGSFELDLRDLEILDGVSAEIQVGAGELDVVLPDDVTAEITARVGAGELDLAGRSTGGFGLERSTTVVVGDGSGQLDLELQMGLGELTVHRP